jgi:CBS domain-containing protein/sporulation protein YlmC with PRC-barrel domain
MPLFGHIFLSELLKRPVFDPKGEVAGRVTDAIVVKGDPLPKIAGVVVTRDRTAYHLPWHDVAIFNRRILSVQCDANALERYERDEDLLAVRHILDKQIVDANGVKVVRVNDIRLEGHDGDVVLSAVDVGVRGLLRRLGIERRSEVLFTFLKIPLPWNLIAWNYIQPLTPKLKTISLTVPQQMVAALHPADLAELINQVSREEGATLFTDLDVKTAADALSELEPQRQVELITGLDAEKAADILEEMPPDEASDVLADLPTEKAREILERVEEDEAKEIQELLAYDEDTAGGLMTTALIAYTPETSVREAIERFRTDAGAVESVYHVYVVEAADRLVGTISLRALLLAGPSATLASIADLKPRTVPPETDRRAIAALMAKYDLIALPVVDGKGHLLGVVTIDDIISQLSPARGRRKRKGA